MGENLRNRAVLVARPAPMLAENQHLLPTARRLAMGENLRNRAVLVARPASMLAENQHLLPPARRHAMGATLRNRSVLVARPAPYACGEPAPIATYPAPRNG